MTDVELKKMAQFYLNKLFYGIPEIPVHFASMTSTELGDFEVRPGESYDSDDDLMYNTPGYRNISLNFGYGIHYYESGKSWSDPLNKPKLCIKISDRIKWDKLKVVGILLHELLHYFCWHYGYDYDDSSEDFIRLAKQLNLPFVENVIWDGEKFIDAFNYEEMKPYYNMFAASLS